MNRSKLANLVRSNYPKAFGIRKKMQRLRILRLQERLLPKDLVALGEAEPGKKAEIIAPYMEKWHDYMIPYVREMEMILEKAPAYQTCENMEALRTDIMFCKLAYGFLPSEYCGFGLEKKTPEERKAYASDIDRFIFCYTVDDITALQNYLDKAKEYKLFKKYYGRDAVALETAKDKRAFVEFIDRHPQFVKKNVYLSMGNSVELIDSRGQDPEALFQTLIANGKVLLEEKVTQHETMAALNASSVNTVRCATFLTKKGVEIPFCFLKVGRSGSFVDNGGQGGILIGLDKETGRIDSDGFDEYGSCFSEHPDSHIVFKGYQLPAWDEMLAVCRQMATENPDVRYVGWDMAYTERGWVVIEANGLGQFIGPQTIRKRGIKEEINAYFAEMEHVV